MTLKYELKNTEQTCFISREYLVYDTYCDPCG
jgi:hypothetical protein